MMSCWSELQSVVVKRVYGDAFNRRGRLIWLRREGGGGGTPRAAVPFVVWAVSMFNVLVEHTLNVNLFAITVVLCVQNAH